MQHERNFISNFGLAGGGTGSGADVVNIAKKYLGETNGQIANSAQRENITLHKMKEHAFGLTLQRSGDEGAKASAASSMFKYYGTEHNKDRYELMIAGMALKRQRLLSTRSRSHLTPFLISIRFKIMATLVKK